MYCRGYKSVLEHSVLHIHELLSYEEGRLMAENRQEEARRAQEIRAGETALGIELGSTNIKAVLVGKDCRTLASASYGWENQLEDGIWTYDLEQVWAGIQTCFTEIKAQVSARYQAPLKALGSIGVSAMMHGYLPFASDGRQLAAFRTWRNNITGEAADALTEEFSFNIPQRWSIAHLYQAILNGETSAREIDFLTTLAGYVHWRLSGERVLGIGDASGMFPIDEASGTYDAALAAKFDALPRVAAQPWQLLDILPRVLRAGACAGHLTAEGARLLDLSGQLAPGALLAPPEGDAGTGMVSTNAVRKRTGNISVGTSAFSMNVLDAPLRQVHRDIDVVTTPAGAPVAMVHTNNCTSDLNAWVKLFGEFAAAIGRPLAGKELYGTLLGASREADADAGGLLNYSCLSGENITEVEAGRPLFVRTPHSRMNLANFMRAQLYGCFAPLRLGMDILAGEEGVETDVMIAQGGLFKTPVIAQQALADCLGLPISVMKTAGEGGPWGMAVLAVFAKWHAGEDLADFLDETAFPQAERTTLAPTEAGRRGAQAFLAAYQKGLAVERGAAVIPDHA